MKRRITSLLILCPFALFAQTNFTIKGTVSGPKSTLKWIYLDYNDSKAEHFDSVKMKNGAFEVSGTMLDDYYNTATISIGDSIMQAANNQLPLYIKKGDNVNIDVKTDMQTAAITGSEQSVAFRSAEDSLSHSDNIDASLAIPKRLIGKYPDSRMTLTAFSDRFQGNLKQSDFNQVTKVIDVYNGLSPRIRNTKEGAAYGVLLKNLSYIVVDGTLPDFTAKTPDGKTIKLSDLRGKYVLVDFWASWCVPCRAEFPYLKKAYARFKNKNFEILGYSIDTKRALWVSALENDDVHWLNASNLVGARDPIALNYDVHAIPSNFLIGPDGKVIAINLRGELVEPTLAKYIK